MSSLYACSVIVETDPSVIVQRIAVRVSNTLPSTACSMHSALLSPSFPGLFPSFSMLHVEETREPIYYRDEASHAS